MGYGIKINGVTICEANEQKDVFYQKVTALLMKDERSKNMPKKTV